MRPRAAPYAKEPRGYGRFDWPKNRQRMSNPRKMPTWFDEALTGATLGVLVFLGLTVLLVVIGVIVIHWL
jgi:hypothetical protein